MKKLLLLIAIVLGFTSVFAQPPAGMKMPGAAANLAAHLYGKLTDNDGKAIGEATVLLMENKIDTITKKSKQILYKSVVTQANGDFSFEDVSLKGKYTLKISSVGFKAYELPVSFFNKTTDGTMQPPSTDKDLGKIKMVADAKELQSVTVVSSSPTMKLSGDKKYLM